MRGELTKVLKNFAESKGYGFAFDIVPTGLLNEKYPCIFWVVPDATFDAVKARWVYPSTFYIVAPKAKGKNVDAILDDLQMLCRDLFLFLQKSRPMGYFVDKTMKCNPKAGFDNSGAVAMEMKLNIYESDECR